MMPYVQHVIAHVTFTVYSYFFIIEMVLNNISMNFNISMVLSITILFLQFSELLIIVIRIPVSVFFIRFMLVH